MGSPDERGARVRWGLQRALQRGAVLGGLRPARREANQQAHAEALQVALAYQQILVAGEGKTLAALSKALFAAGCRTSSGRPLSPEAVRRLRRRLQEALAAVAAGDLDDPSAEWEPGYEIRRAASERNEVALRWLLQMARKEYGDRFADARVSELLASEHAEWVRAVLAIP